MFSMKNIWFCLGISIAVLAGIWTFITAALPTWGVPTWLTIATWPAFVAWALYFAKGGGNDAMVKTITGNIFGIIIAALCVGLLVALKITSGMVTALVLAIIVVVAAFILTMGGNFTITGYVPAAFAGTACGFGAGVGLTSTSIQVAIAVVISMVCGALLARASDIWGNAMLKKD